MDGQETARDLVKQAMREHEPPLSPAALARAAGVDVQTVRAMLKLERWPRADKLASIDTGLGQRPGTIEAWAAGDAAFFARANDVPAQEPPAEVVVDWPDLLTRVPLDDLVAEVRRRAAHGVG